MAYCSKFVLNAREVPRNANRRQGCGEIAPEGMSYLQTLVDKQVKAGADHLDLDVDEFSWNLEEQKAPMRWLMWAVEPLSCVPLSIDSSNQEILWTGIQACQGLAGKPMLNSASRERIEALDVAAIHGLPVVVTAAGGAGMPQNAEEHIANAS
jgi:cobalamin-dependent methionine synthase I